MPFLGFDLLRGLNQQTRGKPGIFICMSDFNAGGFPFFDGGFDPDQFNPKEFAQFLESMGIDPNQVVPGGVENLSPAILQQMLQQATFVMKSSGGPINWQLVQQIFRQGAWGEGDLQLSAAQAAQARQALQVADLWLDAVTDIAPVSSVRKAWRRSDWADKTLDIWKVIVEPVAVNVERAFKDAFSQQMQHFADFDEADFERLSESPEFAMLRNLPGMSGVEGLKSLFAQGDSLISEMSAAVFSLQIGRALGELSHAALGSTDVGIPGPEAVTALVLPNVDAFAAGFDIPIDEVRQFAALRECAHARLFMSVPWLKAEFIGLISQYASLIRIDTDAIRQAVTEVGPLDHEGLQLALSDKLFKPDPLPAQRVALERLEGLLALIEGWVETVTFEAARPYLPNAGQLREIMRRRRIDGSAAEQVLVSLIGLQLRPRKTRNATQLWEILGADGVVARDAYWRHPDVAPSAAELDSPGDFLANRQLRDAVDTSIDAELGALLDGTLGWAEGLGPEVDSEGDAF